MLNKIEIELTNDELKILDTLIDESGLSQHDYIYHKILNIKLDDSDELIPLIPVNINNKNV